MSSLAFLCLIVWRSTTYTFELVLSKKEHEKNVQALRALQKYANAVVVENPEYFKKFERKLIVDFEHWPTNESDTQAQIIWEQQNNAIIKISRLITGSKVVLESKSVEQ